MLGKTAWGGESAEREQPPFLVTAPLLPARSAIRAGRPAHVKQPGLLNRLALSDETRLISD